MTENRKCNRFRYAMRTQRFKQHIQFIQRELPHRKTYRPDQILFYLALQGHHIDESELVKLSLKLFNRKNSLNAEQVIGLVARLSVQDEVERELRKVFDFFSGGQETLTAQDLKNALERLGENVKEKQMNQMLNDMDLNSDGYIDFETFLEAMLVQ